MMRMCPATAISGNDKHTNFSFVKKKKKTRKQCDMTTFPDVYFRGNTTRYLDEIPVYPVVIRRVIWTSSPKIDRPSQTFGKIQARAEKRGLKTERCGHPIVLVRETTAKTNCTIGRRGSDMRVE